MFWLIIGIIIFYGVHIIPSRTSLRQRSVAAIGELPYKGVFAVVSFIGLGLMITGLIRAPYIAVWNPPAIASTLAAIIMLPAFILLVASNLNGNIKRIARHPMALGFLLFSASHVFANGDLATMIFFASFGLYALYDMRPSNASPAPEKPDSIKYDLIAAVIGVIIYFLFFIFHAKLFGVAVF